MSTQCLSESAAEMRSQLGDFLARNMENPSVGWPLRASSGGVQAASQASSGSLAGLRTLIVGDLTLELPVDVATTRQQLLTALRGQSPAESFRWAPAELRAGGFVARTARAAVALGARVSVCVIIPIPTPARLDRFLEEHGVDRRYLTGVPSPCPIDMLFRCQDGVVVERHRRRSVTIASNLPPAAADDFDVILVDPCGLRERNALLSSVSSCLDHGTEHLTLAFRLDGRAGGDEISIAQETGVWTFVRLHDAMQLVGRMTNGSVSGLGTLAKRLHDDYGIARLVLQGGPRGAVLMNGVPVPHRVETCPLASSSDIFPGDTLMAVTALSSAAGANDRASLRRGVAAATGLVAGLPLPSSLEELDDI